MGNTEISHKINGDPYRSCWIALAFPSMRYRVWQSGWPNIWLQEQTDLSSWRNFFYNLKELFWARFYQWVAIAEVLIAHCTADSCCCLQSKSTEMWCLTGKVLLATLDFQQFLPYRSRIFFVLFAEQQGLCTVFLCFIWAETLNFRWKALTCCNILRMKQLL